MTHQAHPSVTREVVQVLAEHGFDGMAHARLEPPGLEAIGLALAEMYVQGVSTSKVTKITEELCGCEISSSDVSRATALLDEDLQKWRTRPLGQIKYLVLDARYEKIRHGGSIVDCSALIAIAVDAEGRRSVLGVSVSLSEAEVHWREFFKSLIERGLHAVELITSDAHAGLKEARKACFPGVPWQRCRFHLMRNALAHVPREEMKQEVMDDLRSVLDSANEHAAGEQLGRVVRKYQKSAPKLSAWMEENVPESFAVFRLPPAHRQRLRTTNMLERVNRELKRRTRVATLIPNEASLLRLVTAVLMELSEEWETGKRYVTFETK